MTTKRVVTAQKCFILILRQLKYDFMSEYDLNTSCYLIFISICLCFQCCNVFWIGKKCGKWWIVNIFVDIWNATTKLNCHLLFENSKVPWDCFEKNSYLKYSTVRLTLGCFHPFYHQNIQVNCIIVQCLHKVLLFSDDKLFNATLCTCIKKGILQLKYWRFSIKLKKYCLKKLKPNYGGIYPIRSVSLATLISHQLLSSNIKEFLITKVLEL